MKAAVTAAGVNTTVNYVLNRPAAGEPILEFVSEDETLSTLETLPGTPVFITDARQAAAEGTQFDLDTDGFRLYAHTSSITDFDQVEEDAEVDGCYTEEILAWTRELTGAALVMRLGHPKKRYGESAHDKLLGLANAKPARFPHADLTGEASMSVLQSVCPDYESRFRRQAIYKTWRATSAPPQDLPLAVCAANTVSPRDEVPVTVVTKTRAEGDYLAPTFSYEANPDHRWYYYRDMTSDELLVFKAFDSDPTRASRVAHTAFSDPSCPADTPTRSSVELTVATFFE